MHGAVVTAGHVLDAMNVLKEQGAEIYVGRCHREVCNVHGLFKFDPKLIARPSVSDLKRNPIAGDFALVEAPKNVAQLGLKVGRVGFSAVSNDVVSSGHYRLVSGKWVFHRTFGICQFGTPPIAGQEHPWGLLLVWRVSVECVRVPTVVCHQGIGRCQHWSSRDRESLDRCGRESYVYFSLFHIQASDVFQ